ncbi:MAG: hypothetical protein SGARI_000928 [Bacillariaceae sp.]
MPDALTHFDEAAFATTATQIKIAGGGGGVSSTIDPVDVQDFTFEEVKAVVDTAECWDTYVTSHASHDKGIRPIGAIHRRTSI